MSAFIERVPIDTYITQRIWFQVCTGLPCEVSVKEFNRQMAWIPDTLENEQCNSYLNVSDIQRRVHKGTKLKAMTS